MARNKKTTTKVESIKHKDKRTNIPTEELRDFVVEEELAPKTMLYPRDPSLDPQLVWKGKDEQDREDLAVPVVPVYIQEKIHPQAIIDALPRIEKAGDNQINLFADFNGGPTDFEQKVDFYHHKQNWSNRLILGDSLLVMTSLAEKEGLKGKVQTIYFDPPYGIKFGSNWQVSTRKRDVKDGKAEDATRQPEQVRAFRDTWKLGIHSYLAYLRDRLVVARDLLTETGSVFVQIGDENVHLVRCVMDEVFGSENFVAQIAYQTTPYATSTTLPAVFDTILWYARSKEHVKYRQLYKPKESMDSIDRFSSLLSPDGSHVRPMTQEEVQTGNTPPGWTQFQLVSLISPGPSSKPDPFEFQGRSFLPPANAHWKTTTDGLRQATAAFRIQSTANTVRFRSFITDFPISVTHNIWTDTSGGISSRTEEKMYVVQTSPKVIERCVLMTTDPGDLILDPTCGSGTTAYVAEQWGRRWITCDTSRVALALARTRLMAAKYPYYLLADSPEGVRKEMEMTGKIPLTPPFPKGEVAVVEEGNPPFAKGEAEGRGISSDIRKGFVYKRVPHVTLKSIANNPDIKEGMTRE